VGAFFNRTFSALGACLANASGSQMQIAMGTTIFIDLLRTRFGWEWRSCSKQRWRQIVPVSSKKPKQKRCHLILLSGLCQRFLMLILKVQLVCNITEWRTEVKLVGKKKYRRRLLREI